MAALILFLVANAYPIVELDVRGSRQAASLYDAVHTLWIGGREDMAVLVGCTTMLLPALEMALLIYVLVPLKFNRIVIGTVPVLRFIQTVRPWSMMEVFLLGILVSLVKLQHIAHVEAGIALWAFCGLIPMLTAGTISFNSEELWAKIRR